MFEAIYESDNGKKFVFGRSGSNWFTMDFWQGVEIYLGTAQGFSQVGETVQTQSVGGRTINVSGRIYGDVAAVKGAMRSACAPLSSGKLTINGKYICRVYVKAAPSFSPHKNNGLFKMQFFAPFPFFRAAEGKHFAIGGMEKLFQLPVNYATPHMFGRKSVSSYTNVINDGDVRVPFRLQITASGIIHNPRITNIQTFKFLRFNTTISAGEYLEVYRDDSNVLRAYLHSGESVTDAISLIDEDSTLFELDPGDNMILAGDDSGGAMVVSIDFSPAKAVLYES